MNREAYEELYRQKWLVQNKIDREVNKKLKEPPVNYKQQRENGLKGGRPRQKAYDPPRDITVELSEKAKIVNRMLNKGMKLREVGEILGISHQAVSHIKQQYGLPRKNVK